MSEKKIVVPEGIRSAAAHAVFEQCGRVNYHPQIRVALEAALRWLSENPIVPTSKDIDDMVDSVWTDAKVRPYQRAGIDIAVEWQRRMFDAPEPEVPEEVKDLLANTTNEDLHPSQVKHHEWINKQILEAFHRGQKAIK